jgi:nucleoside-diphosphate-sugar epimerase
VQPELTHLKEPCLQVPIAKVKPLRDAAIGQNRRVLVTGANGFIGRKVCAELPQFGFRALAVVRKPDQVSQVEAVEYLGLGNIDEHTDWMAALAGVDCIVHLAARVHVMEDTSQDPLAEYRRVNVAQTMNLARQAAVAGVRRLVYISSIKVNGEATPVGQPFTAEDEPNPQDPYGVSKLEAEQALLKLADETGLEIVIIRPPLVYGPGVKANFLAMMRVVARGVPLPFGALDNYRSLVGIDNLASMIITCLCHPAAANQIFLVSDGDDMTVAALLRKIAGYLESPMVLIPIHKWVIKAISYLIGKEQYANRILGNLRVDITKSQVLLDWLPPKSVDAGLEEVSTEFCRMLKN